MAGKSPRVVGALAYELVIAANSEQSIKSQLRAWEQSLSTKIFVDVELRGDAKQAMQEVIRGAQQVSKALEDQKGRITANMQALEAQGKTGTQEYQKLTKALGEVEKQINSVSEAAKRQSQGSTQSAKQLQGESENIAKALNAQAASLRNLVQAKGIDDKEAVARLTRIRESALGLADAARKAGASSTEINRFTQAAANAQRTISYLSGEAARLSFGDLVRQFSPVLQVMQNLIPVTGAVGGGLGIAAGGVGSLGSAGLAAAPQIFALTTGLQGLLRSFGAGANFTADFEQALANARGTLSASDKDLQQVAASAGDLGREFGLAKTQITQVYEELGTSGVNVEKALGGVARATTLISRATGESLQISTSIGAQVSQVFDDVQGDFEKIADITVNAANTTRLSVADLNEAIGQGGRGVAIARLTYADFATSVATIRPAASSASDAATALSNAVQRLYAPTKDGAAILKQWNVEVYDATGAAKPFFDVIEQISKATANLTEKQRNQNLVTILGADGLKGLLPLLRQNTDELRKQSDELNKSGTAYEAFEKRTDTLRGSQERLKAALQNFLTADPGESPILQTFKSINDIITNIINAAAKPTVFNIRVAFGQDKSGVAASFDKATGERFIDPVKGLGLEVAISDAERRLKEAQIKLNAIGREQLQTPVGKIMAEGLRKQIQDITKELQDYRKELEALLKTEFKPQTPPPSQQQRSQQARARALADTLRAFGGNVNSVTTSQLAGANANRDVTGDGRPDYGAQGHDGLDLKIGGNGRVFNPFGGARVLQAGPMGAYGNALRLQLDDQTEVILGHFKTLGVKAGDILTKGVELGIQGSTGNSSAPHLHVGFKVNGQTIYDQAKLEQLMTIYGQRSADAFKAGLTDVDLTDASRLAQASVALDGSTDAGAIANLNKEVEAFKKRGQEFAALYEAQLTAAKNAQEKRSQVEREAEQKRELQRRASLDSFKQSIEQETSLQTLRTTVAQQNAAAQAAVRSGDEKAFADAVARREAAQQRLTSLERQNTQQANERERERQRDLTEKLRKTLDDATDKQLSNRLKQEQENAKSQNEIVRSGAQERIRIILSEFEKRVEIIQQKSEEAKRAQIAANDQMADALLRNAAAQAARENREREERIARLQKEGEEAAKAEAERFRASMIARYGDGAQAAIDAIRRSYPDIKSALEAGFDQELVFAAFSAEFTDNLFKAGRAAQTLIGADTGWADMGAKLGQQTGQAFAGAVQQSVGESLFKLRLGDTDLNTLPLADLNKLKADLEKAGLKSSETYAKVRDAIEKATTAAEDAARSELDRFRQSITARYGDGVQATLDAIRKSYPDIKSALESGLDAELVFSAFPDEFGKNAQRAVLASFDLGDTGYADYGAKAGKSFTEGFKTPMAELRKNWEKLFLSDQTDIVGPDSPNGSAFAGLGDISEIRKGQIDELGLQVRELAQDFASGKISADDYALALIRVDQGYAEIADFGDLTADQLREVDEAAKRARAALASIRGELKPDNARDNTVIGDVNEQLEQMERAVDIVASRLDGLPNIITPDDFPLLDIIDELVDTQLEALDKAIAALSPTDPELQRLTELRDRLREIAALNQARRTEGQLGANGPITGADGSPDKPTETIPGVGAANIERDMIAFQQRLQQLSQDFRAGKITADDYRRGVEQVKTGYGELLTRGSATSEQILRIRDNLKEFTTNLELLDPAFADIAKQVNEIVDVADKLIRAALQLGTAFDEQASPGTRVGAALGGVGDILSLIPIPQAQAIGGIVKAVSGFAQPIIDGIIDLFDAGRTKLAGDIKQRSESLRFASSSIFDSAVRRYLAGSIIKIEKVELDQKAADNIQSIAQTFEDAVVQGISSGLLEAAKTGDFGAFQKRWKESLGNATLNALIDGFLKGAVLKGILQPAIDAVVLAFADGIEGNEGDALAQLDAAFGKASGVAERFYRDVLLPIAKKYGLYDPPKGDSQPTAAQTPTIGLNVPIGPALAAPNWWLEPPQWLDRFGVYVDKLVNQGITLKLEGGKQSWSTGNNMGVV